MGVIVFLHAVFPALNMLEVTSMFWPTPVTAIWSMALVIAGLTLLYFFLRDERERKRYGIVIAAKVNLSIWVFASSVWIVVGATGLLIVSIFNVLFMAYVAMAAALSRKSHRV